MSNINEPPQVDKRIIKRVMNEVVEFLEIYENSRNNWAVSIEERLIAIEEQLLSIKEQLTGYEEDSKTLLKTIKSYKVEADSKRVKDTIFPTKMVSETNRTINGQLTIKETRGMGIISQLLLISESDNYTLNIMIDNFNIYDKPYSYFLENSTYLDNITTTIKDGKYYLTMPNFQFEKRFKIQIITTKDSVYFNEIMLRYEIKDEKEF